MWKWMGFRLKRIGSAIWGKFDSKAELKKFFVLAFTFCLIIGTYWTMRPIKDGIFKVIIGMDWQPVAKMISLVVILPLIILYGKLIDSYERHKVFYILLTVYAVLALVFMGLFMHPTIGLANTDTNPYRIIGWCWYVFVESFGSLIVALFWAITVDTTDSESAKRGFPMIALFGQTGNILGPKFITAQKLGFATSAPIIGICAAMMLSIVGLMYYFITTTPKRLLIGFKGAEVTVKGKSKKAGFFDGLRLLFSNAYLCGIFAIVSVYEIIVTIIDFHFKKTASIAFAGETGFSNYLGEYGFWTGIIATACVLLGVNNIQRKLGMRASLVLLPLMVATAVCAIWMYPTWLQLAFWIMVGAKAINYALNQPTLKQLYIPTSRETKYKAQAWIEMFGSRGSKAIGSGANYPRQFMELAMFLSFVGLMSGGLIAFWLFVATYVARVYTKAVKENKVVC